MQYGFRRIAETSKSLSMRIAPLGTVDSFSSRSLRTDDVLVLNTRVNHHSCLGLHTQELSFRTLN